MTLPPDQTYLLVDAHVHLHACFDLVQFLNSSLENFRDYSRQLALAQPVTGALLLAEVSDTNAFDNLVSQQQQLSQQLLDWEICPTTEAHSLWAKHIAGDSILITAGRQVVTQEGIEVLALITAASIEEGLSLEDTLEQVDRAGGLPVLPWGVGKWIGKRGKLVEAQLQADSPPLFTGDNGGRPGLWPLPDYFQLRPQLPGSDPLPLPREVNRAGSFGFLTQGALSWSTPGESLKQILRSPRPLLQDYGRSLSLWKFVQNQSLIRIG
ncbi:MAG: hypothetical protein WBB01_11135 [Phormidesmis sp.]